MRERAGWLIFLPEPCDFDQNAPSPAVAGLGYSLAPRRRSAVIGARCKTEIRSQLPSAGEGSGEHLASKDCRAGGAHSVQRDEQLSLLFDHRVLRVGRVAFLLSDWRGADPSGRLSVGSAKRADGVSHRPPGPAPAPAEFSKSAEDRVARGTCYRTLDSKITAASTVYALLHISLIMSRR